MKLNKYIAACAVGVLALASCAKDWTEPKAEVYPNQENLKRLVPFLEAKGEADLTPTMRKHYEEIAEYRKSDHVLGFGWFGNWTAKGSDPMSYLKALPDSVDMVSIWGTKGALTEDQKADLKFYQDIKHGKAMLCWIVQDTGDQLTPEGVTQQEYWFNQKGERDYAKAAEAYADAIADTIVKYRLDGFDIDYESGYGHYSRWSNIAQPSRIISREDNHVAFAFIKRLYDRFQAETAKDGRKRLIAFDGEPHLLGEEAASMIDYFIYQAYWERTSQMVLGKMRGVSHLPNHERKTIITVEFEQTWRTGGIHRNSQATIGSGRQTYTSEKYPELNGQAYSAQLLDYATLDWPSGIRVAGIGSYHMEYDKQDYPYKWLRMALDRANKELPGRFQ